MHAVLVTGGAGFIGSHLCDYLLARGARVLCVDNLFTGSRRNIARLRGNKAFAFIRHDIIEPLYVKERISEIYNLACPASPVHYQENPIRTVKANTIGMINVLGLAKKHRARILQASTSEVYGDPAEHPQKETYRGNVNPIGPRACFSDDTEILTDTGWKKMMDATLKDKIATLDKNGGLEYQHSTEIIKQRYIGELIAFSNYQCDLLVTPNHSMYVRERDDLKRKQFKLLPAYESIRWERARMLKVAAYDAKDQEWFCFPLNAEARKNAKFPWVEKITMDDWLEFFGYFITEGCTYKRRRKRIVNGKLYEGQDYYVLIAQSEEKNSENYEKIKRCLTRLPFTFGVFNDHQFYIANKQLYFYLNQFGKSHQKFIPRDLLGLSHRQLTILFEAMMLGDGSKRGDVYFSNSYRLISNFQELLLKVGYAGNISMHDKRKRKPLYNIHILNRFNSKYKTPSYPKQTVKWYDGFVYCVTVPNHIVFVRRNGKALFCGNCYDEGKRVAETLCFDYHRSHGIEIRVARIFNTYGPRMARNDGRVISNFVVQALAGKPLTVYGDGAQTRSFCYMSDMVRGLYALMHARDLTGPVNLGNPREYTIRDIAERVVALTGSRSRIVRKPLPEDDPKQRRPDITLARTKLRWEPQVKLEEGLKKTIDYFSALREDFFNE